jgi:CheY-like chemotaxis protein
MPLCDGYELLAEIQGNPKQNLLFYLMTGYADISTAEALQRGANRLIHKPFSIDELCLLLEAQLLRKK